MRRAMMTISQTNTYNLVEKVWEAPTKQERSLKELHTIGYYHQALCLKPQIVGRLRDNNNIQNRLCTNEPTTLSTYVSSAVTACTQWAVGLEANGTVVRWYIYNNERRLTARAVKTTWCTRMPVVRLAHFKSCGDLPDALRC